MFRESVLNIIKDYMSENQVSSLLYAKIINKVDYGNYYEYTIRVLNKNKEPDANYPAIPKIIENSGYDINNIVIIAAMYSDMSKIEIIKKVV